MQEGISLKAARIDANLTQKQLADLLDVDKKTVSNWELGKSMPNVDRIEAICAALGRSYKEIRWRG